MKKILCNVESVKFQYQDRKILILDWFVKLEDEAYGSFSAMNLVLDTYDKELKARVGTAYGSEMIRQTLDFFGVDNFNEIKNYKCYALTNVDRVMCATDIIGFEQLPFDEYSRNQKHLIKKDIYNQFVVKDDNPE